MTESRQSNTMLSGTPPASYAQPVFRPRTNGSAVASLVLGIVWLSGLGAVLALVFGYKAKREIDASNGAEVGRGMAIAGIVLGWIGVVLPVLLILLSVVIFAAGGSVDDAQKSSCRAEKSSVLAATEAFRAQTGDYPVDTSQLVGTYLRSTPKWYTVSGSTVTASGPCA